MSNHRYGRDAVERWASSRCPSLEVYNIGPVESHWRDRLHAGMVLAGAVPFLAGLVDDDVPEVCVLSRCYLDRDQILSPPAGVRAHIIEAPEFMGPADTGLPVLHWIEATTPESEALLRSYRYVPLQWLPYLTPSPQPVEVHGDYLGSVTLCWPAARPPTFRPGLTQLHGHA